MLFQRTDKNNKWTNENFLLFLYFRLFHHFQFRFIFENNLIDDSTVLWIVKSNLILKDTENLLNLENFINFIQKIDLNAIKDTAWDLPLFVNAKNKTNFKFTILVKRASLIFNKELDNELTYLRENNYNFDYKNLSIGDEDFEKKLELFFKVIVAFCISYDNFNEWSLFSIGNLKFYNSSWIINGLDGLINKSGARLNKIILTVGILVEGDKDTFIKNYFTDRNSLSNVSSDLILRLISKELVFLILPHIYFFVVVKINKKQRNLLLAVSDFTTKNFETEIRDNFVDIYEQIKKIDSHWCLFIQTNVILSFDFRYGKGGVFFRAPENRFSGEPTVENVLKNSNFIPPCESKNMRIWKIANPSYEVNFYWTNAKI